MAKRRATRRRDGIRVTINGDRHVDTASVVLDGHPSTVARALGRAVQSAVAEHLADDRPIYSAEVTLGTVFKDDT